MKEIDKQKRDDKQRVMFLNCSKLVLCNKELNYIFRQADSEEIKIYNSDRFLISFIERTNIQFCVLSSILLTDSEEYSIPRFINEFIPDGDRKREIRNTVNDYEFQKAFKRIRKLRDKCYVHIDKDEPKVREQIKLVQDERDLITNGLINSIKLIYAESKAGYLDFFDNHPADIKSQIRMINEWRTYNVRDLTERIKSYKRQSTTKK